MEHPNPDKDLKIEIVKWVLEFRSANVETKLVIADCKAIYEFIVGYVK